MNPLQQLLAALQGGGQPQQNGYVSPQDMSAYAPQMHPMAPQMPAQTQGASYGMSAPQTPQSAPAGNSGGGIGGFVENLFNPGASKKNQTIQWLTSQGMHPGMAQIVASDRGMLQRYLVDRSKGTDPMEALKAQKLQLEVKKLQQGPTTNDITSFEYAQQHPDYLKYLEDMKKAGASKVSVDLNKGSDTFSIPLRSPFNTLSRIEE